MSGGNDVDAHPFSAAAVERGVQAMFDASAVPMEVLRGLLPIALKAVTNSGKTDSSSRARATVDVTVAEGGVKCNRNPGICCQPFECLQKGCIA